MDRWTDVSSVSEESEAIPPTWNTLSSVGLGSVGLIKRAFCPGCYGLDLTLKCTEVCTVCVREADFVMTSEFLEDKQRSLGNTLHSWILVFLDTMFLSWITLEA